MAEGRPRATPVTARRGEDQPHELSNVFADNADGASRFEHSSVPSQVTIRGISLFTPRPNASTGIDISQPAACAVGAVDG